MNVRATIQNETDKISEYIRKMPPRDKLLNEYLRLQKLNGEEQLEPSREDKPLHGIYPHQTEVAAKIRKTIPVVGKPRLKLHRGANDCSRRTGSKYKSNRSWDLPLQARDKVPSSAGSENRWRECIIWTSMISVIITALGAVIQLIPGRTSEIYGKKLAVLGTAKTVSFEAYFQINQTSQVICMTLKDSWR